MAELCADWFKDEPGLTTAVLRWLFGEFANRWGYAQAVPTAEYTPFNDDLLPEVETLSKLIPLTTEAQRVTALESLVRTFRDCGSAANWW